MSQPAFDDFCENLQEGAIFRFWTPKMEAVSRHFHVCFKISSERLYFVLCTSQEDKMKKLVDSGRLAGETIPYIITYTNQWAEIGRNEQVVNYQIVMYVLSAYCCKVGLIWHTFEK